MVEAVAWIPKDPDETIGYELDWLPLGIAADDTIVSSEWVDVSGVTINAETIATSLTATMVMLAGGVDGTTASLTNRIVTAAGETLEQVVLLPIVAQAALVPLVGYTKPTPGHFLARYPSFAAVPYLTIQDYLTEAGKRVDESWTQGDYARAMMLYAAHEMTIDGLGTGTQAQLAAQGLGDFQRIKSGSLDVQRFDRSKGGDALASTSYGQRFAALQRLNFAGARVVAGHIRRRFNAGATDC